MANTLSAHAICLYISIDTMAYVNQLIKMAVIDTFTLWTEIWQVREQCLYWEHDADEIVARRKQGYWC